MRQRSTQIIVLSVHFVRTWLALEVSEYLVVFVHHARYVVLYAIAKRFAVDLLWLNWITFRHFRSNCAGRQNKDVKLCARLHFGMVHIKKCHKSERLDHSCFTLARPHSAPIPFELALNASWAGSYQKTVVSSMDIVSSWLCFTGRWKQLPSQPERLTYMFRLASEWVVCSRRVAPLIHHAIIIKQKRLIGQIAETEHVAALQRTVVARTTAPPMWAISDYHIIVPCD